MVILSLPSNRLIGLPESLPLPSLQELYVSHNAIISLPSFASTPRLRVLDISSNQVAHLENLAPLQELEELWASDNLLDSFEELEQELANKEGMQTVYLERNPLQKRAGVNYRNKVRLVIPQIKQIDASELYSPILQLFICDLYSSIIAKLTITSLAFVR